MSWIVTIFYVTTPTVTRGFGRNLIRDCTLTFAPIYRTKSGYFNTQFKFEILCFSKQDSCIPHIFINYINITCFEVLRTPSGDVYIYKTKERWKMRVLPVQYETSRDKNKGTCTMDTRRK